MATIIESDVLGTGCSLPKPMNPQRHEVVHLIVRLGDIGKHASHTSLLLRLRDGLIAEMRAALLLLRSCGIGVGC